MVAINPDGTLKWLAKYGTYASTVTVDGGGTIYFGSGTDESGGLSAVFALNPDGNLKREYDDPNAGGRVRTPVARALETGSRPSG